jgi:multidrug efflux pump subunit AcrA (membrane-fusion protein)
MKAFIYALMLTVSFGVKANLIKYAKVETGSLEKTVKVSGRVVAEEGGNIIQSARISGRVVKVSKREGDVVKVNESLITVNGHECSAMIEEKKNARNKDQKEMLNLLEEKLKLLGVRLGKDSCELVSMANGIVTKNSMQVGSSFNEGDELLSLINSSKVLAELDIGEHQVEDVKVGAKVNFGLTFGKFNYESKIERIVPYLDPSTRSLKARLSKVDLPKEIVPGMLIFATVELKSSNLALKVPTTALIFHEGKRIILKKESKEIIPVAVDVIGESEQSSIIRVTENKLKVDDEIISKGGIFALKKLYMEGKVHE